MGEVLEAAWLLLTSFLRGNTGFAAFLSLPVVFGALGYSFRVTALVSIAVYIVINVDRPKSHDRNEEMAWLFGFLVIYLIAFWVVHKAAQYLFRPVVPVHLWLIDSIRNRK